MRWRTAKHWTLLTFSCSKCNTQCRVLWKVWTKALSVTRCLLLSLRTYQWYQQPSKVRSASTNTGLRKKNRSSSRWFREVEKMWVSSQIQIGQKWLFISMPVHNKSTGRQKESSKRRPSSCPSHHLSSQLLHKASQRGRWFKELSTLCLTKEAPRRSCSAPSRNFTVWIWTRMTQLIRLSARHSPSTSPKLHWSSSYPNQSNSLEMETSNLSLLLSHLVWRIW